jgi:hypothetical protein
VTLGLRTAITACAICLWVTSVYAEPLVMPRDLVEYARAKDCEQVLDFYDRPGAVRPPYVYGYLPGRPNRSAVFWCQTGQGADRKFWLVTKRDRAIKDYDCPDIVEWPRYPGGLSIEHAGFAAGEFVYLSEWDQPKRVIPRNIRLSGNGIQSEYDGLESLFYCYRGEWIVRMRH